MDKLLTIEIVHSTLRAPSYGRGRSQPSAVPTFLTGRLRLLPLFPAVDLPALFLGRAAGSLLAQGGRAGHQALEGVGLGPGRAQVLEEGARLLLRDWLLLQLLDDQHAGPLADLHLDPVADDEVAGRLGCPRSDPASGGK